MQTYTQTFAAASTWVLNVTGKYFVTLGCTVNLNIRFYKGGKKLDLGDITGLQTGLEVGPLAGLTDEPAFDRVEIDVTASDTVQVGIGNGQARYNRAAGSVIVSQAKAPISGAFANVAKTVTNASASMLAANANRQYLLIQNNDTLGNICVTFGSAATLANGVKIVPGGSYELNGVIPSAQIFAIGDIASNANIVTVEG